MNRQLGIVLHPVYPKADEKPDAYLARVTLETKAIAALGFGAIRLHFNCDNLIDPGSDTVHPWGMTYARTMLQAVKAVGFRCLVTLAEGPVVESVAASKWLMQVSAEMFGPTDLAWIVRNEPVKWYKGEVDPDTYAIGQALVKFWDESKLHSKGYWLYSPSYAGYHFKDDPGYELAENIRYIRSRHMENRIGLTQRTGCAAVDYVLPDNAPYLARLKAFAIKALIRTELLASQPYAFVECGIRWDIKDAPITEYAKGKLTGQSLKGPLETGADFVVLYDYNGGNPLSIRGRRDFQRGLLVGLR